MTKEFFIEENKKINDELIILRNRETELIKKYIDSNKEFEVGEKVKVTSEKGVIEFGFISKVKLNYSSQIEYEVVKEKKDGTPSQHKLYVWYSSKISSRTEIEP